MKVKELKRMLEQVKNEEQEIYIDYDGYSLETVCGFEVANASSSSNYNKGVHIIAEV